MLPHENERLRRNRQFLDDYKLARGCADCGYRAHPAALDFDHRPGTTKLFGLGIGRHYSRTKMLAELEKCDVVCANCHRIRTAERGYPRPSRPAPEPPLTLFEQPVAAATSAR